jgi:hypothetical protein
MLFYRKMPTGAGRKRETANRHRYLEYRGRFAEISAGRKPYRYSFFGY